MHPSHTSIQLCVVEGGSKRYPNQSHWQGIVQDIVPQAIARSGRWADDAHPAVLLNDVWMR